MELTEFWNVPMASENFANDGIVRLFGNGTLSASVVRRQIPSHDLHHPITWILEIGDANKQIRVGKVVGVHLQEGAPLEDERRQHNLRQIHADLHLRQEMRHNRAVRLHWQIIVGLVLVNCWRESPSREETINHSRN